MNGKGLTPDRLRGRLAARTPVRADPTDRREAAVAIVLAPRARAMADLDLLFIKRSERADDPWSGQMALPGGRREPGDRDLLETAMRETLEETGVRLSRGELVGELDDLAPVTPVLPPVVVRPFVFGLGTRPPVVPSSEVELHLWAPLSELGATLDEVEIEVHGVRRTFSCFRVGGEIVWGMTYRIISGFLHLAL